MHEHILAAVIADDEAEALLGVEELHGAGAFADHLRGHAAAATGAAEAATTAAATETAAAATAEAIAAATAAAEAITAATETAAATAAEAITAAAETATAEAATEVTAAETAAIFAEAVPLVPTTALTAPPSIKTHAAEFFPTCRPNHFAAPGGGRAAGASA
ncbi:hypothetical protein FHS31_002497 [Sphingomonas vulcanisoli]|uniref:Uncharacterized protein n=1 Tax=Sphingomonas vulcanisoli TaxID=1658060 RepID=A0ABX0TTM4_9SPHN|nr:hypothetical protein [Sphingomonas vulcanisoli]